MMMGTETTVNEALTVATDMADVAAATGNPVAGAVALGLTAAGDVAQSVETGVAAGQTPAALAAAAAGSLVGAATPAVAALPPAQQAHAAGILASIEALISDFIKLI
jgi:hypothetical protein